MNTNMNKISDIELDTNLKQLILKEREVLTEILLHIFEVDRRKLYLNLAYPNLFEYLTKHVGYSNGSAQRRIDAARLLKEIPTVTRELEAGHVNLAQISLLQKSIRQVQNETKNKVALQTKVDLFTKLANKTISESQVLVAEALNIELKQAPKTTFQKDESVRFEVTLTKAQWEKMNLMRELLSNSLPNGSWDQVLEYISDKVIAQKSVSKKVKATDEAKTNDVQSQRKYISKNIQRQIFERDRSCQFHDSNSGKRCGSTWQLNLDHIRPVWAGCGNDASNLRVLCGNHNRLVYLKQTNTRSI